MATVRAPDPVTPTSPGWRQDLVRASGANVVAGTWLVVSPLAVGGLSAPVARATIVFGALVACFAAIRARGAYDDAWLSWCNALTGSWVFFSGFWAAGSVAAAVNLHVTGAAIVLLATVSIVATQDGRASGASPEE